jgi:uncharacterized membrane protein YagU involved in acid resistance
MSNKITQSLIGGIVATTAMTLFMMLAPMMGMPKMSAAEMLSMMMGVPVLVGWLLHYMIGIIFAMIYAFLFIRLVKKVKSNVLRGLIFGFAAFVFAQIFMALMGAIMGGMPPMKDNMMLMIAGSIMGHLIFGIVVALIVKESMADGFAN